MKFFQFWAELPWWLRHVALQVLLRLRLRGVARAA